MKYAILSDIHGNLPALNAVLADAEAQKSDMFLLLGDYGTAFPWINEVAETIRSLDSFVALRGNHEDYMLALQNQNQKDWIYEQLKGVYWSYRALTEENRKYLMSLPEDATISDDGENIYLTHILDLFFRSPKIDFFQSTSFRDLMEKSPFSHKEYLKRGREALLSRSDALSDISALPKGVYLFGHNHLQFHMEYDGRIFINPGSCGLPCDFDPRAAYTVLKRFKDSWNIVERRVEYNISEAVQGLKNSALHLEAPIWSKLNEDSAKSGMNSIGKFIIHLAKTGRIFGETEMPLSNNIWEEAVKTWDWC